MKNQLVIWFGESLRNEWDRVWQREQEICSWLAKDNTVIYVERLNVFNRRFLSALRGVTKRLISFSRGRSAGAQIEGLHFLQPILIPYHFRSLDGINSMLLGRQIRRQLANNHHTGFFVWISNPSKFVLLALRTLPKPVLTVYQCTERYQYRKGFNSTELKFEREISQKADLVTVHSKISMAEKLKLNKNTHYIPESAAPWQIDFADKQVNVNAGSLCRTGEPKICYFGSFHHVFDFELIRRAAEYYREYCFILWGPITSKAKQKLSQIGNIKLAGFLPHDEAISRLSKCDVCIIPYIRNEYSVGVFPHKLFSYFASGRPVVASRLPELEDFESWLELAEDQEEFLHLLNRAVKNARDPKYMFHRAKKIPRLLQKYSLTENLKKINTLVEQLLEM